MRREKAPQQRPRVACACIDRVHAVRCRAAFVRSIRGQQQLAQHQVLRAALDSKRQQRQPVLREVLPHRVT